MQKLFSLKLITKNPRKFASQSIRSNPISHHQAPNVPHHHHHNHGIYHYTTCSKPLQQTPTNCLMKVLSNPLLLRHFLPNGLSKLKSSSKLFVSDGGFGSLTAQFQRHGFQINQPISYQKTWLSQFRRRLTVDNTVIGLIVANVAVFLLWRVADRRFMVQNFMVQVDNFKSGRIHTMITAAFSHNEVGHIVSNMIGLYFFGKSIGHQFGPEFLIKLYLAGAFVGSAFYLVHHAFLSLQNKRMFERDPSKVPGLGASGAVNAILLLDIFLNPTKTIYLEFILPVPAILLGIFFIGHDMMRILEGNSQVSGSAHLGGAAVAVIAWARMRKGRF
ncbi:RHOMBOID-like protein 12, mitochondrial [Rutidosis leptorrhynchoides]|uniref:RHOMBOID-like protein 12, mitochondrial n=1 Tax=Rutidosis leptorrhynchoides TaxID=125765 RepID=UPI003A99A6D7